MARVQIRLEATTAHDLLGLLALNAKQVSFLLLKLYINSHNSYYCISNSLTHYRKSKGHI